MRPETYASPQNDPDGDGEPLLDTHEGYSEQLEPTYNQDEVGDSGVAVQVSPRSQPDANLSDIEKDSFDDRMDSLLKKEDNHGKEEDVSEPNAPERDLESVDSALVAIDSIMEPNVLSTFQSGVQLGKAPADMVQVQPCSLNICTLKVCTLATYFECFCFWGCCCPRVYSV